MFFLKNPNLPKKKVIAAVAWDCDATKNLEVEILIPTFPVSTLPYPLNFHADLQLHHMGGNTFLSCPEAYEYYKQKLSPLGAYIIKGETGLRCNYPEDIAYNIARIRGIAIHNTKYTDPEAKKYFSENGVILHHVNQGYSKCQVAVCGKNHIITSDPGIYAVATGCGLNTLLIEQGHIFLEGFDYGFFGGCAALTKPGELYLTGSIKNHPSRNKIYAFLEKHHIELFESAESPPVDIGSIICIA